MHKDKFSCSRYSVWHALQCNSGVKDDSVWKPERNYRPQVYVEECKYTDAENQQCKMLSDDDDNDDNEFFVGVKRRLKRFL